LSPKTWVFSSFSLSNHVAAEPLLADAIECLNKYKTSLKPKKKLDKQFGNVLLDIMTAMCSQSCLFLREVALSVFRSCSQFVEPDALLSMTGQLMPNDNQAVEESNDEGDDDSEEDESEDDDDDNDDDHDHHPANNAEEIESASEAVECGPEGSDETDNDGSEYD
ncbi:hypothetical protein BVRB_036530, partial [Beta vulgaris subsp. vulgaris]